MIDGFQPVHTRQTSGEHGLQCGSGGPCAAAFFPPICQAPRWRRHVVFRSLVCFFRFSKDSHLARPSLPSSMRDLLCPAMELDTRGYMLVAFCHLFRFFSRRDGSRSWRRYWAVRRFLSIVLAQCLSQGYDSSHPAMPQYKGPIHDHPPSFRPAGSLFCTAGFPFFRVHTRRCVEDSPFGYYSHNAFRRAMI